MGSALYIWLEYDAYEDPPFGLDDGEQECLALDAWVDLSSNKDYRFMGAVAGVRNQSDIPPLFERRGAPPNPGRAFRVHEDQFGTVTPGWLHPGEVWAALHHHGVVIAELSLEVQVLLSAMHCLERNLGSRRVRLVFDIHSA